MFEYLEEYKHILVTGPQRSGTRIASKMIAHDLGYRYVDESEIHADSLYTLVTLIHNEDNVVVQCPALCRDIDFFGDLPDTLIVMMHRDIQDIEASETRIGWDRSWKCLEQFRYYTDGSVAQAKYQYWRAHQRCAIVHYLELNYADLEGHSLWVPKERRADFRFNQTEEEWR